MTRRKEQAAYVPGTAPHRRIEADYLRTLLDTVTPDDWREVVAATLAAAKQGDAQARAWLAHYLIGKPATPAPSALTVLVQQLNGRDPVAERLASPIIERMRFPGMHSDDDMADRICALIAEELACKIGSDATASTAGAIDP